VRLFLTLFSNFVHNNMLFCLRSTLLDTI
jgi:hypothetical protein